MSATIEVRAHPVDLPEGSVQPMVWDSRATSRIGLGVLLHRQPWVSRCLLAASREEAVALATHHKPDIAIVDVSDAGPFIATFLSPIKAAHPSMPIMLTSSCRIVAAPLLSIAGVVGLLDPATTPEELLDSVRSGLVSGASLTVVASPSRIELLSDREREVLELISTGATNREIAAIMHVGTETVKKHAGALYRKLGVRNRTEAAQRAFELLAV